MLYKYPQAAFPYAQLVEENPPPRPAASRSSSCIDTGIFDDDRYFDVYVEYAKADADDMLMRITVHNRGPEQARDPSAAASLVPQHLERGSRRAKPRSSRAGPTASSIAHHEQLGLYHAPVRRPDRPALLRQRDQVARLFGVERAARLSSRTRFTNTSSHGDARCRQSGSASAPRPPALYRCDVAGGRSIDVRVRLRCGDQPHARASPTSTRSSRTRIAEADAFYAELQTGHRRRRHAPRPAPGLRRHDLEQAVLLLRRPRVAQRRPGCSRRRRAAARRPQQRVDASQQRRHHLHAGQMGISRGTPPGIWPSTASRWR